MIHFVFLLFKFIIRENSISVQCGFSARLEMLLDVGINILTKLVDMGAWIIAYQLLKSLRVYGTVSNTTAFVLLSAEIYIANQRPLKAFDLLKRECRPVFTSALKKIIIYFFIFFLYDQFHCKLNQ